MSFLINIVIGLQLKPMNFGKKHGYKKLGHLMQI